MFYSGLGSKGNDALRLLTLAEKKLTAAVLSITNFEALFQLGAVYQHMAKLHTDNVKRVRRKFRRISGKNRKKILLGPLEFTRL